MRAKWMAIVGLAAAVVGGGGGFVGLGKTPAPTWAQMAESFKAEKFVCATLSIKADADSRPEESELWLSSDRRARMREAAAMVFAQEGHVTQTFDLKSRQPATASAAAAERLARLTSKRGLSLDVVLGGIAGARGMETTPLLEPAEVCLSEEVIFDVHSQTSPEVIHVWMDLRSKLPTRMRLSNPRTGGFVEAAFSYPKDLHRRFFEPPVAEEQVARVATER